MLATLLIFLFSCYGIAKKIPSFLNKEDISLPPDSSSYLARNFSIMVTPTKSIRLSFEKSSYNDKERLIRHQQQQQINNADDGFVIPSGMNQTSSYEAAESENNVHEQHSSDAGSIKLHAVNEENYQSSFLLEPAGVVIAATISYGGPPLVLSMDNFQSNEVFNSFITFTDSLALENNLNVASSLDKTILKVCALNVAITCIEVEFIIDSGASISNVTPAVFDILKLGGSFLPRESTTLHDGRRITYGIKPVMVIAHEDCARQAISTVVSVVCDPNIDHNILSKQAMEQLGLSVCPGYELFRRTPC